MVNGITDIVTTVPVPKPEYEELVRESNTLRIIENYIQEEKYPTIGTLKSILGIEKESEEK